MIDLTLLNPQTTPAQVEAICREGRRYGFATVCIPPAYVALAAAVLDGGPVKAATVVGFPLGYEPSRIKACAASEAVRHGAGELDMVLNLGLLKAGRLEAVEGDIARVVEAAGGVPVKVILECCYLTREEKVAACHAARSAGARFVKTSTGMGPQGATVDDVRLLRETVGSAMGVKAAGGIRDLRTALAMIQAGANRLGTSAGLAILEEMRASSA
ncbi:MAG: deoxyribose-phosphate aldolase [Acetobacteraceae bacterium]|nr:deoxyribose-phosphate aldolase [Acetobacteraceae bacterium]